MKLKSLLLGSAAAMIAVTGARAADAIVAEPHPVEYVRVCDMYGAGFFYIPGTETCLRIDGYVRVDYTFINRDDPLVDSDRWDYRARINFDARNETDYGTLRSQLRIQGDGNGGGDADAGIDRALISLAGFELGYSDTFNTTFHGYGMPVEKYDGYYGYDQAVFFGYNYAANGFRAGIGVQSSVADSAEYTGVAADGTLNPDYYAGIGYAGSWGSINGSMQYETAVDDWAWKVSASITAVEGLNIKGFYVGDDNGTTRLVEGAGDWAYGIGASYQITDMFRVHGGYTENDDPNTAYGVVGAIYNPVAGLSIRPEVRFFTDTDRQDYSIRVYRTF